MKSLNVSSAILAGLIGTLAMTALMYAAPLMGLPPMDLLQALGSLVPLGISPYIAGAMIHLANGVVLALIYALLFERMLPGPRWARGAAFSLLPWLFTITLMGPAMAWLQGTVSHAEARMIANPCSVSAPQKPTNPCGAVAAKPVNPCAAAAPKTVNPCAAAAPKPVNPCAAAPQGSEASSPWVVPMMSLVAHLVYGAGVATVYRRRA